MSVRNRVCAGIWCIFWITGCGQLIHASDESGTGYERFEVTGKAQSTWESVESKEIPTIHWTIQKKQNERGSLVIIESENGPSCTVVLDDKNNVTRIDTEKFVAGKWRRFTVPAEYTDLELRYGFLPISELLRAVGLPNSLRKSGSRWKLIVEDVK